MDGARSALVQLVEGERSNAIVVAKSKTSDEERMKELADADLCEASEFKSEGV